MLIVCPTCATSYNVEPASLRPNGRQVRCVRCRTVWRAELSHAEKLLAAAEALGPARHLIGTAAQAVAEDPDQPAEPHASTGGEAEWPGYSSDKDSAQVQAFAGPTDVDRAQTAADPSLAADGEAGNFEAGDFAEPEAPSIVPVDLDEHQPPIDVAADDGAADDDEPHRDIETIAARRYRPSFQKPRRRWPLSRLQTVILVLALIDSIIVGWRVDFVRVIPQTASFFALMGLSVNLRSLDFADIATATEQHDGVPILVVEGNIVNGSGRIVDVPRLKFAVRNAAKQEIYSWTAVPPRPMLPPGEAVAFHTRLASPPPDGRDVLVRFVTRRDIVAGDR